MEIDNRKLTDLIDKFSTIMDQLEVITNKINSLEKYYSDKDQITNTTIDLDTYYPTCNLITEESSIKNDQSSKNESHEMTPEEKLIHKMSPNMKELWNSMTTDEENAKQESTEMINAKKEISAEWHSLTNLQQYFTECYLRDCK